MKKVKGKSKTQDYLHLREDASAALELPDDERILRMLRNRWIGYSRAQQIMKKIEMLFNYPQTHRMPNLLIVGDTNNGKTMIVEQFAKRHPAHDNPDGESISVPVLMVQAPNVPDEDRFYMNILDKIFAPYKPNSKPAAKQAEAIRSLIRVGLRMLIVDDLHNILAGPTEKTRQFLGVIRFLGNELRVPIVGTGTKDALRAVRNDKQLDNRFEPAPLPKWKLDTDFFRLLASFEKMLPLKRPSNLIELTMAARLHGACEGNLGELASVLRMAAVEAVESGIERIDDDVLDAIDFKGPSGRAEIARQFI